MKNTFKKIFKILYGCDDNIKYKIISTLFITSVIETILSFMYKDNAFLSNLFSNFSGIGFALFLIFLRGFEFSKKIRVKSKFVCKFIFQLCGFIYATFIFKRFD